MLCKSVGSLSCAVSSCLSSKDAPSFFLLVWLVIASSRGREPRSPSRVLPVCVCLFADWCASAGCSSSIPPAVRSPHCRPSEPASPTSSSSRHGRQDSGLLQGTGRTRSDEEEEDRQRRAERTTDRTGGADACCALCVVIRSQSPSSGMRSEPATSDRYHSTARAATPVSDLALSPFPRVCSRSRTP